MTKFTADTITDAQIRELLETSNNPTERYEARIALGVFKDGRMGSSNAEIKQARVHCAEILNARTRKETK